MKKLLAAIITSSLLISSTLFCFTVKSILKDFEQLAKKKHEATNASNFKATIIGEADHYHNNTLTLKLFFKDTTDPIVATIEGTGKKIISIPNDKCLEKVEFHAAKDELQTTVNVTRCEKGNFSIEIKKTYSWNRWGYPTDEIENIVQYFITITTNKSQYRGDAKKRWWT